MNQIPGLHVLHIIKGLDIGGNNGGSENFGLRLLRCLRQRGVQVSLCSFYQYGTPVEIAWVQTLEQEGIRVVFANASPRLNLWEGYRSLSRFIRQYSVNLVHSHFQVGTLVGLLLKVTGKVSRLVRTAHFPLEFGTGLAARVSRLLFVQGAYPLLVDAEAAVARFLTEMLNDRWLARLLHKKAFLIYNALASDLPVQVTADPFERFKSGMQEEPWIITGIGVLETRKRFDTLIQAMPEILRNIPYARLALVGSGPERERLQELAEQLGVSEQVWFLGQRTDIGSILRHSQIFVLPSIREALSTVILEAMQQGVPVIASEIPGNTELVIPGETGWLFPPEDSASLAQALITAYHHPELREAYARNASDRLALFSLDRVVDQYIQLYQQFSGKQASQ